MKMAHWSNSEFRLLMPSNVMTKETQRKYTNISTSALGLFKVFKSLCEECQEKRKRPMAKGVVIRPVPRKESASRGHADLVNMQCVSRSNCKRIVVTCIRTISRSSLF